MICRKVRFGENIKVLRSKNGITQEQLAEAVHVARQTVSAWEKNVSYPDILMFAKLSSLFAISMDELLYGKVSLQETKLKEELYIEEPLEYIRSIKQKGFYDIIEDDISEFFPIIGFEFSRIMGIALELWEKGYQIVSLYANGFGIYFETDQEAEGFSKVLYYVIEEIVHHEEDKTVVNYTEKAQQRIDEVEIEIIEEMFEQIFGFKSDEMYYWIDEDERLRGYGKSEDECREQALKQGVANYNILHG